MHNKYHKWDKQNLKFPNKLIKHYLYYKIYAINITHYTAEFLEMCNIYHVSSFYAFISFLF